MTDAVIEFAKWVIQESVFDGCDLDGVTVQEKALELGLLTKTSYDPEKHGENEYAEPGGDWYVFSNLLTQTDPSPAPEAQLAARTGGVKPLDLSNLLRHAYFGGFMIAGGSQEAAAEWWPEYDPETCPAYSRILSALEPAAPEGQQEPVAWGVFYRGKIVAVSLHKGYHYTVPLYTRPSEQAVTEAMVEAVRKLILDDVDVWLSDDTIRAALKAAMEAGR